MRKGFFLLWAAVIVLAALYPMLSEAEECNTLNSTNWTVDQKNMIESVSYRVIFDAGENIVPVVVFNEDKTSVQICVPGSALDIPNVLTPAALLAEYNQWVAEDQAALAAEQAKQDGWEDELVTSDICTKTLAQQVQKIDDIMDPVSNLAEAKAAIKVIMKKIAKCLKAKTGLLGKE